MKVNEIITYAIFDTGANVSLINHNFITKHNISFVPSSHEDVFNTPSGNGVILGRTFLKMSIGVLEYKVKLYVSSNMSHDILIGLNIIHKFRLCLNEKLQIVQNSKDDVPLRILTSNRMKFKHVNELKNVCYSLKPNDSKRSSISKNEINDRNQLGDNEMLRKARRENSINSNENSYSKVLNSLIVKYNEIFSNNKYDVGQLRLEKCRIELVNNIPINLRPYRCSDSVQKRIDEKIKMLLEHNLIRESTSSYAFPVTLADKKDEGEQERLCIDYRQLNKIVMRESFPFPKIEEITDRILDCKFMTKLDIRSSFWHIRMHPEDIPKTAFVTRDNHLEWLVMPFGYTNSPQIFQRAIRKFIRKYKLSTYTENYMDDILVFSKSFDEHIMHIENIFNALRNENIKLKYEKCEFFKSEVDFLGHRIGSNRIKPLSDNIEAIIKFNKPSNIKEVQRFIGKINFYHKFLPNAPKLLEPLYNLLRKGEQFNWNDQAEESFNKVKDYLSKYPILRIYNPKKECYLYTDACKIGVGAVLKQIQEDDNELHPIGYFSKKLLKYQMSYSITELECYAIIESIDFWHFYLIDNHFTIVTDHNALKWLKSIKKPNSRLFNWSLRLSQYNFDVIYQRGKFNVEADALSRNPIEGNEKGNLLKTVNLIELVEIKNHQKKDKNKNIKKCVTHNDFLVRKKNDNVRIFIPESLRKNIIEKCHMKYGHIGSSKILKILSPQYYWPLMNDDINNYVKSCLTCCRNKSKPGKKFGELSQLGPATEPFKIISIDTVGGLNGYGSVKCYLHVAIDNFSRFVWYTCSKSQTAKDFINLLNQIISLKKPECIVADQYAGIKSKELINYLEKNDIKIIFIPAHSPQSNGMCERVNATLVTRLRCYFNENSNKKLSWPNAMKNLVTQYNETPHSVTGYAPMFLLLGVNSISNPLNNSNVSLEQARKIALNKSNAHHEKSKVKYDQSHEKFSFQPGDNVFIQYKNKIQRKKLDPLYSGPHKVIKKFSNVLYEVETDKQGKKTEVVHINNMRPYQNSM